MKHSVLNINNFHFPRGGSDRYFLELTELLKDEGHRTSTFSAAHPLSINNNWLVVSPTKRVNTECGDSLSNILRFCFNRQARDLMEQANSIFRPDIAHLHIYYGQLTASILKPLRKSGVPIVQTLHEYKIVCATHGLYANGKYCDACQGKSFWHAPLKRCNRGSLSRSTLSMIEAYASKLLGSSRNIDHFIAVSEFQKKQLIRLGVAENKLSVLYHFKNVFNAPPEHEGEYFLYVGRIVRDKGIGILLEAYAKIEERNRLPLKIVGDGGEIEQWKLFAESLSLKEEVEWLGYKDGKELEDLYRGCLAVVNPSQLNETFGLTCIESLAQGRPIIVSNIGAFPEVCSDGVDGILVPPGDISSLTEAMIDLSRNASEALEMGIRGREKIKNCFPRKKHYEGLIEIYNMVSHG